MAHTMQRIFVLRDTEITPFFQLILRTTGTELSGFVMVVFTFRDIFKFFFSFSTPQEFFFNNLVPGYFFFSEQNLFFLTKSAFTYIWKMILNNFIHLNTNAFVYVQLVPKKEHWFAFGLNMR